jgi:hypothetical protein
MTEAWRQALAAMDDGDLGRLGQVLAAHPEVVRETAGVDDDTYAGYFANATLLHHVAGNPIRGPLPANVVDVARALIDAGADVRARCGGGPAQPDTGGGTVMGLVASGMQMAESGLYRPMIDLLLSRGDSLDDDRGVLAVCLYHTVECQRQREVGEYLAGKGAKVDLVFAAALGRTDEVSGFLAGGGALTADAHGPFRSDAAERRARGDDAIKQEALVWAAMNGRDATVTQLLDAGVPIGGTARVAAWDITPLHGAAWAGWAGTAALLLARGADVAAADPREGATPVGWAAHCRRAEVLDLFRTACAGRLSLIDSVAAGDVAAVEAALEDVDVNAAPPGVKSRPGVLLRTAASCGRADIVRLLLSRGADPTLKNANDQTAFDCARERGIREVMDLLAPPDRGEA